MKKLLFINLMIAGVLVSAFYFGFARAKSYTPPPPPHFVPTPTPASAPLAKGEKALELVFVIDTTGSMSGLIEGAKQRVWGIVNEVMQNQSRPRVRVGLVAYRDRGDEYVTQVTQLTEDLDAVYSRLMDFRADGGGDTPENVRRALADGVNHAGWSQRSDNVAQILFLVGDAPPHDDYQDEPNTTATVREAMQRHMIVNTIQCGNIAGTRETWQRIAREGQGEYFSIAQDGGVAVITTPYDQKLGDLSNQLGRTYMTYGLAKEQAAKKERQYAASDKIAAAAPMPAQAERAANKALNSRAYADDFLQELENGSLKLESLKADNLPVELQKLSAAERKQEIDKRLAERRTIREQITQLAKQRDEHIANERKKQKGQTGFDSAVSSALKAQLAKKGIR
jgi:Mg-chelatase subunit ChlD